MPDIYIGKQYEKAFESICSLNEKSGGLLKDLIEEATFKKKRGTEGTIVTADNTFILSDRDDEKKAKSKNGFKANGATWFASLRGEESSDGLSAWNTLMSSVSERYHKEYAFTEFKQSSVPASDKEKGKKNIKKTVFTFFKDILFKSTDDINILEADEKDSSEDIYCASLRIRLTNGTGEASPVLAKVYYKAVTNKQSGEVIMAPLHTEEAQLIDAFLRHAFFEDSSSKNDDITYISQTVINITNALDELFNDDNGLGRCICYSSEKDEEVVNSAVEQGAHDDFKIECTSVELLGISHVRWANTAFNICVNEGAAVFRAVLSLNDTISLICLNCGQTLIESGVINIDGKKKVRIDISKENAGLTKEQFNKVRSAFALHHRLLCAGIIPRINKQCTRRVCNAGTVNLGTQKEPKIKCRDCPYPEVVYWDGYEKRYDPHDMVFAHDIMRMIKKEEALKCSCCGQSFSKEGVKNGKCSFCNKAFSATGEDAKSAKKLYSRYSRVFSPISRLFSIGRQKMCFERHDIILFVIGKKKYAFDKKQLETDGYLRRPRRIK